jgi:hypothetical protein
VCCSSHRVHVRHSYDPRSRCLSPLARARSKGLWPVAVAAAVGAVGLLGGPLGDRFVQGLSVWVDGGLLFDVHARDQPVA